MVDTTVHIRPADERGATELGWLSSRHSFSFGSYYDPGHMGFRSLRVINDDRVQAGQGFGTHPHRDMEIISIVVDGALEHQDSMGNGSVIRPGDVQRMTAGTGVTHSEFNPSPTDTVRFLQVWIEPEARGLEPGYEQRTFDLESRRNRWVLVASREGRDGSLTVHQDVALFRAVIERGSQLVHRVADGRHLWVQMISGSVELDRRELSAGDGAAVIGVDQLIVSGLAPVSDVLLFDLS
jgi:redox-sensitive bicupin YhaK (pirin superfamily)